jgi:hypothetical protein
MRIEKAEHEGSIAAEQAKTKKFGIEEAAAEKSATAAMSASSSDIDVNSAELKPSTIAHAKAAAAQRLAMKAAEGPSDAIDWTKAREQGAEQMKNVALQVLFLILCDRMRTFVNLYVLFLGQNGYTW